MICVRYESKPLFLRNKTDLVHAHQRVSDGYKSHKMQSCQSRGKLPA